MSPSWGRLQKEMNPQVSPRVFIVSPNEGQHMERTITFPSPAPVRDPALRAKIAGPSFSDLRKSQRSLPPPRLHVTIAYFQCRGVILFQIQSPRSSRKPPDDKGAWGRSTGYTLSPHPAATPLQHFHHSNTPHLSPPACGRAYPWGFSAAACACRVEGW